MSKFVVTNQKGFHLTFENGWTVSVQWGRVTIAVETVPALMLLRIPTLGNQTTQKLRPGMPTTTGTTSSSTR